MRLIKELTQEDIGKNVTMLLKICNLADSEKVFTISFNQGKDKIYYSVFKDGKASIKEIEALKKYKIGEEVVVEGTIAALRTCEDAANFFKKITIKNIVKKESDADKPTAKEILNNSIKEIKNKEIKKFVLNTIKKVGVKNIQETPFSRYYCFNYKGGLFEYILKMIQVYNSSRDYLNYGNNDIVIATILVHRLGKVSCLTLSENIELSEEGMILGDVLKTAELILPELEVISDEKTRKYLKGVILTTKGKRAYGSPEDAILLEAKMIHYLEKLVLQSEELEKYNSSLDEGTYIKTSNGSLQIKK